ncbi:hypothetical protein MA16_Dca001949 [Dendrobium catenatum]|uniref:DUF676 domain-containing protein n=1 Tax=Dendrobium catenatum TaxID=906689 RepID=A0A2I0XDX6_9ASPA|nr:hypothetical protein MA16_Dca001949 [Dendrobium catenatum]
MAWLARSLVNSLRGDDDQGSEHNLSTKPGNDDRSGDLVHTDDEPQSPSRGVKEDLSELTKTITRQFWGVASFLAPPPDSPPSDRSRVPDPSDTAVDGVSDESEVSKSPRIAGIRSDFAELGGRFKSGISILSSTKAVSEISKIASTFLPFGDDDAEQEEEDGEPSGEALGITEEVLLFVRNISLHPETWLDFPLIDEDEDPDAERPILACCIWASNSLTTSSCSNCNMRRLTLDGVDVMGERLAEEVADVTNRRPELKKISFVAHSVGGLVARYALGRLYRPPGGKVLENSDCIDEDDTRGTICGLQAINFITVATPHLGSRGNGQVPFLFGLTAMEALASRVVHWIFGRTGKHLFLTDNDNGELPLLLRMVNDCSGLYFL